MKKEKLIQILIGVISLVVFIYLAEILVEDIERYLPLNLNPLWLVFSLSLILIIFIILYFIFKKWKNKPYLIAPLFIGPIIFSIVTIFASFEPGSGTLKTNETLTIKELSTKSRELMLPLFFKNSGKTLSKKRTEEFLKRFNTLNSCAHDTIFIIGYASSREFEQNNEIENRNLANNRAKFVENVLRTHTDTPIKVHEWNTLFEMENAVRINDRDIDRELLPELEALNRRVEVIWKNMNCSVFKK